MDTQSLQAFLAVADYGSFSLAAEQLHLTQPAVSKRIAGLEGQVGAQLFDRLNRRVTLTEAGRTLLPRARQILVMFDDSRRALSNLSGDVSGSLTMATSHHVGLHRLPPLLKAYTQAYPDVRMDMRFLDSEQAYQGVLDGDLELAVVTLAPVPDPALTVVPVWIDQLRFVCGHEHALAGHDTLALSALSDYDAVLPGHLTFTRGIVVETFARDGLQVNVSLSTNYLETLKMMVAIGLGWSVLPESMIDDDIKLMPIEHRPIQRPLGYLFHKSRTLSNAARAMIEMLDAAQDTTAQDWSS
ncbi:LysR family transcriptional regulator [Chromohalobacter canadensis]|uniref:LysR family transcriptional regulator n=1 Tax=Chromohalobacter canadensis TaxID=141389 RepID=A0ABZ0YC38_9GAMM|nr:LysR family transcriptional regulator [Chromohalobacter canadensis]MCK0767760.1 LysR family transcriptional regulator [Chromohalobacter canadensis]MCT8469966.1 LysR family transcriptional regulator [Chromohalobacter canadensis]MCT8471888.1 LysR family transcriptional regulator [Chromohalobacter canadensis]MCT8499341.1 LysR family transcriptional regulator [Chromohalobacter canadensis]WQH09646.1 LysR family transcriptional regulator [Chromohalobacter canadensis]